MKHDHEKGNRDKTERAEEAAHPGPAAVIADIHQPDDLVNHIAAAGVPVERKRIIPADYLVGSVAIGRKTIRDFFNSILKRRLFEHLTRLRDTYAPPVLLLLEGDLSRADELDNPRAFFGALVAVSLDLGLFIVPSPSRAASADLLALMAKRVGKARGHVELRHKPPLLSEAEEQRFAVQGLPGIGDVMSENLLARFGSVRRVFAADHDELLATRGIGPKRAEAISRFLDRPYVPRLSRPEAAPDEAAPESEAQPSGKTTKAA